MNCPNCNRKLTQLDAIDIETNQADTQCENCKAELHIEFEMVVKSIKVV